MNALMIDAMQAGNAATAVMAVGMAGKCHILPVWFFTWAYLRQLYPTSTSNNTAALFLVHL
jgi:hypothetical protein